MKQRTHRITTHTDWLTSKANKFYEEMEKHYPDVTVVNTQVVQLNACVTMFITYCY